MTPTNICVSLPDQEAKKLRMVRVVDESTEDYLFRNGMSSPSPFHAEPDFLRH